MTRRRLSVFLISAMVFVTAVGVYLIRAVEEPHNTKAGPLPVAVEVARITPEDFTHRLEALGSVEAIREAAVGVKVSGPVRAIPPEIELGATVEQGTLLAEVDPTPFHIDVSQKEALVARARAQVRTRQAEIARQKILISINQEKMGLAQAEYERLKSLFDEGGIAWVEVKRVELALRGTEEDFERAKSGLREAEASYAVAQAELASADAELSRAQDALADTRVPAPFAGIISEKSVTIGEQVGPGTVLFRLADIKTVKVLIRISGDDVAFLQPGAEAGIAVTGFAEPLQGRVGHIGPRADAVTRTFPVEILVDNTGPRQLLPGMFARVTVPVRFYPQAILIPRASVLAEEGTPAVFVADADQGVAQRRPVTIARTFGTRYLVSAGLAPGDLLVVTGHRVLRDRTEIRVVETRELAP